MIYWLLFLKKSSQILCFVFFIEKNVVNLEVIATKGGFANFTSKRTLEHLIKNVSKSTFGKLLKNVVLHYLDRGGGGGALSV